MPTRRAALGLAPVIACAGFGIGAWAGDAVRAVAITEVFGEGQKLTAVAIDYGEDIDGVRLTPASFAVEGRAVTGVYASAAPEPRLAVGVGRWVIVELSPDDPAAILVAPMGRSLARRPARARVAQLAPVHAASGAVFPARPSPIETSTTRDLVVEDFKALVFDDPATGDRLAYNLFAPRNHDPSRRYPLVLFMHDMGACGTAVDTTLVQGLGAIVWAGPIDQARHEAFVLAPQYPSPVVDDASQATSLLDTTVHLVEQIAKAHPIDRDRIYATGQSMGAMMSIAMNIKYPALFAASLIVAGQWDAALTAPLAKDKLWIIVAEGDLKAFPGQNAITAVLEREGGRVARATWDGDASAERFAREAAVLRAQRANVNYVVLRKGTVVPPGQDDNGGSNHVNTWRIAYAIEGVRDWLFDQRRGVEENR